MSTKHVRQSKARPSPEPPLGVAVTIASGDILTIDLTYEASS